MTKMCFLATLFACQCNAASAADPAVPYTSSFQLGTAVAGVSLGISAPQTFNANQKMFVEVGTFNVSNAPLNLTYEWFSLRWSVKVYDAAGRVVPENHRKGASFIRGGGWISGDNPLYESVSPRFGFVTQLDLNDEFQLQPGQYSAVFIKDGDDVVFYNESRDALRERIHGKSLVSGRVSFEVR